MGFIPLTGCSVLSAEEKMKKSNCFEVSTRFRLVFVVFFVVFVIFVGL